jgi:cytochrome c biogenesis factor
MQKPIELKRFQTSQTPPPPASEVKDKARFKLLAREVIGDFENLLTQHAALTRIEIQKSMRHMKSGAVTLVLATFLVVAGLIAIVRALAYYMADAFDWSPATGELVSGILTFIVAGILAYVGIKAVQKLGQLPQKISKQWKEEWQWLRKNL